MHNNFKCCASCKEFKPIESFCADRRNKDGMQSSCKNCCNLRRNKRREEKKDAENAKARARYLNNREKILKRNAKSRAKNREKILEGKKKYYEKVKTTKEWKEKEKARRDKNKELKRKYDKDYHLKHKDEKIHRAKEWVKNNPEKRAVIIFNYDSKRRAIISDGATSRELSSWKENTVKVCYWCGLKCENDFHIDHYEPLSKGGSHTIDNLVIACPKCNLTKSAKDPIEFANSIGRLF